MPSQPTLHIRQRAAGKGKHAIQLTLRRPGQPPLEGEATIKFSLSDQEQEDLRWYMEDYLQREEAVEPVTVQQVEALMRARGEELYRLVLAANLERWVGLEPRPLQDWFVPVIYEAAPMHLLSPATAAGAGLALDRPELDPVQTNQALRRYVPDTGFVGRDETLLLLDRAFDAHPVVLLHAYAGQGKTATAVEFARWYAMTGGLGEQPFVVFTSFEQPTDLDDVLNQVGQLFGPLLQANGIEWHALNRPGQRRQWWCSSCARSPCCGSGTTWSRWPASPRGRSRSGPPPSRPSWLTSSSRSSWTALQRQKSCSPAAATSRAGWAARRGASPCRA